MSTDSTTIYVLTTTNKQEFLRGYLQGNSLGRKPKHPQGTESELRGFPRYHTRRT